MRLSFALVVEDAVLEETMLGVCVFMRLVTFKAMDRLLGGWIEVGNNFVPAIGRQ